MISRCLQAKLPTAPSLGCLCFYLHFCLAANLRNDAQAGRLSGKRTDQNTEDSGGWGRRGDVQRWGDLCWREPKKAQFVSLSPNLVDVFLKLLKVNSHAVIHYRKI